MRKEDRADGEGDAVERLEEEVGGGPHTAAHRRDCTPSVEVKSDSRDAAEHRRATAVPGSVSRVRSIRSRTKFEDEISIGKYFNFARLLIRYSLLQQYSKYSKEAAVRGW